MNKNINAFIMIDAIISITLISIGMIFFCEASQYMNDNLAKARKELINKRTNYEQQKGIYDY